ncbi:histidinol-phosphate transaminase [Uliginosibacterium aquaticum]|uniref:Histidinol-phosphate aminotransferase n=1 Tax=Uliginosibacterium aquaticum TaxID=2731212 RepID=A0ABX2ICX3_9RHOO|nr:histidinol-phosphate transaminase [Uliginosibacterium aquaticum]NSL54391.1 histidinol-phosphate transaminase [Uliginosibacterium aquaticum]
MSAYWSDLVHRLTPYVPGEQPKIANLVKLNTNENPYGPSPKALAAIASEASDALRLYPDPNSDLFKQAVARFFAVEPTCVFVGNGSDEVLAHVFMGLLKHDKPLLFPDITYSFYPVYCGLYDIAYETVALDAQFGICVDDYLGREAGAIILANPNAPTSRLLPLADIERLATGQPDAVIVIDEAYIDFGGESAVSLTRRHPNLLVIQTLSKSRSLAGLRAGFAVGQAHLIEGLERVKNSFNSYPLDRMAIVAAAAAMDDVAWFEDTRLRVIASRETLSTEMQALGFEVLPSAANFIFARHPKRDGAELAQALRARSIIVRHFKLPRIDQFLRITIGTDAQCSLLVAALKEILS